LKNLRKNRKGKNIHGYSFFLEKKNGDEYEASMFKKIYLSSNIDGEFLWDISMA
jgi:hypothetical protein